MGFDKNDDGPVVNVQKRTTKVNLWMAVLVLLFLVAGGVAIAWVHSHPVENAQSVDQHAAKP